MADTKAQRITLWGGAIVALALALFPPLFVIDGNDVGHVRYCCLLFLPRLDPNTFVWPLSLLLIGGEWMGVLLLTLIANATVYSLALRGMRATSGAGGTAHVDTWPPSPRNPAV